MGRDKAALATPAGTFLARVVAAVAAVADEVVIVARAGQALPPVGAVRAGVVVRRVDDGREGLGPLEGLRAGLASCAAPVVYATGCDVPGLTPAFVRRVVAALVAAPHAAMALPDVDGRAHPLAAAYRRDLVRPVAEALLARGERRLLALPDALPHVRLGADALRAADPTLASLENVNTPADLEAVVARDRGGGAPAGAEGPTPGGRPPVGRGGSEVPLDPRER